VQAADPFSASEGAGQDAAIDAAVSELFAELGTLVVLPDALLDVAMGLMSCAPAYVALVAEAQVDAGVRREIPAAQGAELVVQTLAGRRAASPSRSRPWWPSAARSPPREDSRARGLDALERAGLRSGVQRGADAVLSDEAP